MKYQQRTNYYSIFASRQKVYKHLLIRLQSVPKVKNYLSKLSEEDVNRVKNKIKIYEYFNFSTEYGPVLYDKNTLGNIYSKEDHDYSMLEFQHYEDYRWQYWMLIDKEGMRPIRIPVYMLFKVLLNLTVETLLYRETTVSAYYRKYKDRMIFHPDTEKDIQEWLPIFEDLCIHARSTSWLQTTLRHWDERNSTEMSMLGQYGRVT